MRSLRLLPAIMPLAATLTLSGCGSSNNGSEYLPFAQCLTAQEFTMYGAFWCPHCTDQKELFGKSFDAIQYVECDPKGENPQPLLCLEKEIKSYPTWIRGDGTRWQGTLQLEELAKYSTCALPESAS